MERTLSELRVTGCNVRAKSYNSYEVREVVAPESVKRSSKSSRASCLSQRSVFLRS
ncbi:hypothetical protein WN51_07992 [Melipona quadrifasciata]|uniref:Uncharacterized protein n=1 Tax=Melipona quadrifasciata TaxID=166423 RepID=A0A0N0BBF1_9HYME|nr:hypothetical protein WN51_07992 [Melipona quadrifasciata]